MDGFQSILGALVWFALTFGAAFVGSRYLPGEWYAGLEKPSWNPPNWIFGPVWTLLYTFMAIAAWLVWRDHGIAGAAIPLVLFVAQLVLNAAWSWIFFGRQEIRAALVEILFLWGAILATMVGFWVLKPLSGILFAPYLAWVTFAAFLNFTIWRLNRQTLG